MLFKYLNNIYPEVLVNITYTYMHTHTHTNTHTHTHTNTHTHTYIYIFCTITLLHFGVVEHSVKFVRVSFSDNAKPNALVEV